MESWIKLDLTEVRRPKKRKNLRQRPIWVREIAHTTVNGVGRVGKLRKKAKR